MPEDEGTHDDSTQPPAQDPQPATGDTDALGDAGKKAIDAMKAERNAAASRAKALERELNQFRQASMSESEKAVAEAEARGRAAASSEFGQRLARSEFAAAAARRNPTYEVAYEYVNLAGLVSDAGEPDAKAIARAVERLVPAAETGPPSFDGGPRITAPKTPDMNDLIRSKAATRN
jgi:hypothetical protein